MSKYLIGPRSAYLDNLWPTFDAFLSSKQNQKLQTNLITIRVATFLKRSRFPMVISSATFLSCQEKPKLDAKPTKKFGSNFKV